jgi:hypothetical protein
MRPASTFVLLGLLLTVLLPVGAPTACVDGCGGEDEAGCAQCPFCASLSAPMVVPVPDTPIAQSAAPHAIPAVRRPHRTEDRGVFHVPRRLA